MVNVKVAEADENDMERIYRHLAKDYCVCNHKKTKHLNGEYECQFESMFMDEGTLKTFKCECKLFVSLEDKAEDTPSK